MHFSRKILNPRFISFAQFYTFVMAPSFYLVSIYRITSIILFHTSCCLIPTLFLFSDRSFNFSTSPPTLILVYHNASWILSSNVHYCVFCAKIFVTARTVQKASMQLHCNPCNASGWKEIPHYSMVCIMWD